MKKYLAGGKAVGGSSSGSSPAMAAQQNASFAAMLAQRETQDAMWKTPLTSPPASYSQQIVVVEQKKPVNTKSKDIDLILGGDYD